MQARFIQPSTPKQQLEAAQLYALMVLDNRKLLLAQQDIRTLEPVTDIRQQQTPPCAVGSILFERQLWPVYSLTGEMTLSRHLEPDRRICVLIAHNDSCFGIVCNRLELVRSSELRLYPKPVCMSQSNSAISALAIHKGDIGLVCTANYLAKFLHKTTTDFQKMDGVCAAPIM